MTPERGSLLTLPPGWEASPLQVPAFARLDDYAGLWLIEPAFAANLWRLAARLDMRAHMEVGSLPAPAAVEKFQAAAGKQVAVIRAEGLLMKQRSSMGGTSTVQLRRDVRQAAGDPDVAGIMLLIDSPGGTVAGTHELADEVRAARKSKPVWAHVEDLGASAAYWLASQAERITANSPTAMIGSIGTFQVIYDVSAAAEKEGIKTLLLSTGPLKGMATPGTKVTDEQVAHLQGLVNAVQGTFDAAVMKGRNLSAKELAAVRHGGVLTAPQAQAAKLIDGVQPLAKTMAEFSRALSGGARAQFEPGEAGCVRSLPLIQCRSLPMLGHS